MEHCNVFSVQITLININANLRSGKNVSKRLICILIKFIVSKMFYQFYNSCVCVSRSHAYLKWKFPVHVCAMRRDANGCECKTSSHDKNFFPTQVKLVQMAYHIIYGLSDCFVGFSFYSGKKGEIFHLETHITWNLSTLELWFCSENHLNCFKTAKTFDNLINFPSKSTAADVCNLRLISICTFFLTLQIKTR